MSQHRNLVSGGFVLFLAATHVGCAGSGLKNIFTRNETDGYHSIDELEAEERKLAEAEESEEAETSPSITARMASWRPFSKPDATEEETYSAYDDVASDVDSNEQTKSQNLISRAFSGRDTVDPDPFLETESAATKRPTPPTFKASPNRELAKLDEKSNAVKKKDTPAAAENEFVLTPEPKSKSKTDKAAKTAALVASNDSDSSDTDAENDDALARRFEQHFLLNSAGAVAKTDAAERAAGSADKLQKKATDIVASADSKQRDVTSIAEKQIDAFDFLLGADASNKAATLKSKAKSAAEPLNAARLQKNVKEVSTDSLAAFDSLIENETDDSRHPVIEAAHTVTQEVQRNSAAVDINVADAEALFGAAAARQSSREKRPATVKTAQAASNEAADSEFHWNDTRGVSTGTDRSVAHAETQGSPASRSRTNASDGHELFHSTAFGAPPVSAGNVEGDDCSMVETSGGPVSVKTAFASHSRAAANRSNGNRSNVVILPASSESSLDSDVSFTAAPVAPLPEQAATEVVAPAAGRPGLIQSLSVRNWMLLIGGIVVIALLFAPGRTKPVTMTSRTANG